MKPFLSALSLIFLAYGVYEPTMNSALYALGGTLFSAMVLVWIESDTSRLKEVQVWSSIKFFLWVILAQASVVDPEDQERWFLIGIPAIFLGFSTLDRWLFHRLFSGIKPLDFALIFGPWAMSAVVFWSRITGQVLEQYPLVWWGLVVVLLLLSCAESVFLFLKNKRKTSALLTVVNFWVGLGSLVCLTGQVQLDSVIFFISLAMMLTLGIQALGAQAGAWVLLWFFPWSVVQVAVSQAFAVIQSQFQVGVVLAMIPFVFVLRPSLRALDLKPQSKLLAYALVIAGVGLGLFKGGALS